MFGRESRLPIDLVFEDVDLGGTIRKKSHAQFVKEWEQSMSEAMTIARTNIRKAAEYNKRYYDGKAKAVELQAGDKVLVRNTKER